jgi:hypothetical protein
MKELYLMKRLTVLLLVGIALFALPAVMGCSHKTAPTNAQPAAGLPTGGLPPTPDPSTPPSFVTKGANAPAAGNASSSK